MRLRDHHTEFERARTDGANLSIDLPPVDVNAVLTANYRFERPLSFDRARLWDMEVRKARRPEVYLPGAVTPGSARTWTTPEQEAAGEDVFVRVSEQPNWADPTRRGMVVEQVGLDHEAGKALFIGTFEYAGAEGAPVRAGDGMPLFHVEHGVGGTDSRPLSTMRWVFLTSDRHESISGHLHRMTGWSDRLPEFIEIYIRDVLGVAIEHRSAAGG